MIKQKPHTLSLKALIFLTLLSLSVDNILSYAFEKWIPDTAMELSDPSDMDGEEENQKEKDDKKEDAKLHNNIFALETKAAHQLLQLLLTKQKWQSIPLAEIQTPPPEFS